MADALVSAAVGGTMCAVSAAAVGYAAVKIEKDALSEQKIPLMAVSGAFIFAAQMINFTIPGTGSSGHIGGGILLAALLGGHPALLTFSAVLIIQCLFFADGGLLALGCNIFNMGILPCLIVYPLLFKPIVSKKHLRLGAISAASVISVIVGLQLGSFGVVLQTQASGIAELPFAPFALLMQPIHLAIGVVEGAVTAAVLCFVHRMRPEILESTVGGATQKTPARKVVLVLGVAALLIGGVFSLFASSHPDGLEWALGKTAGELEATGAVIESAANIQQATAFLPDYDFPAANGTGTPVAGIVGGFITFALAGGTGLLITMLKRAKGGSKHAGHSE